MDVIVNSDSFFVNPADVVFCPMPLIQIGLSVIFLHNCSDAKRIDAPPEQGLEQSNNLKSSVIFYELITSSTVYVFFDNALGFFCACL